MPSSTNLSAKTDHAGAPVAGVRTEAFIQSSVGRVLVVDDDAPNRTLLAEWLGAYGHKVTTAADGMEALKMIEKELPDAIILDVMMPGMDGFAVCQQLKTNPRTAIVPVLLLTALHEREDRLRGMRAGANDFLLKPADLPYVLLRVRNAIHLRQLGRESEKRLAEIKREQQMRESLLHMIVHDLRTPLAGLEGYLQLLQMTTSTKLEERPAHYLAQSLRATQNLARQIDLLLDIHRMEEGKMPVYLGPMDLAEVVDKALEPLRPLFGQRRLLLEAPRPLIALGDPGLLSRVVANLVGNAIAFTPQATGEIKIRLQLAGDFARFEIEDNGPGIEPSKQEAIFDKFFQVGQEVRTRSSGLGLAFCKLALSAQHGHIGVKSQPGAGSRFWFEVPLAEPGKS